ncbi:MAG: hypothetical protein IPJ37_01900 [Bacteroidales bacterium]|nr:hypothetical protein [Bacteroidales bacterium]
MREKNSCEFYWLLMPALVASIIFVNVQCRRVNGTAVSVYSSSQDGDRLAIKDDLRFTAEKNPFFLK